MSNTERLLVSDSPRDREWLENLLAHIWYKYFSDVEQHNTVKIRYGRKAKRRLGSISLDRADTETTIITINPLYQDLEVPEFVVVATIVHEMTHYAHGFNSPLEQKHQHPHSGGVIRKEFAERGLEEMYLEQRDWLKAEWPKIIDKYFEQKAPQYRRATRPIARPWWFR